MRSEQTLGSYSFENVAFHLLRRRLVFERPKCAVIDVDRVQGSSLHAVGFEDMV